MMIDVDEMCMKYTKTYISITVYKSENNDIPWGAWETQVLFLLLFEFNDL